MPRLAPRTFLTALSSLVVLRQIDDRLVFFVGDSEFKKNVGVTTRDVGDKKLSFGNLPRDLTQQFARKDVAISALNSYPVFLFQVFFQIQKEVVSSG